MTQVASFESFASPLIQLVVIHALSDKPIYYGGISAPHTKEDNSHLYEYVLYAALDSLQMMEKPTEMFLKTIDRFGDMSVSAFVTSSQFRFLLLHSYAFPTDILRQYFQEIYCAFATIRLGFMSSKLDYFPEFLRHRFDSVVHHLTRKYLQSHST